MARSFSLSDDLERSTLRANQPSRPPQMKADNGAQKRNKLSAKKLI